MVGTGFVIGVISACLCFMILLTIGVTKQLFNRIRSRLANPFLQEVLPPVIGGIAIGKICKCTFLRSILTYNTPFISFSCFLFS